MVSIKKPDLVLLETLARALATVPDTIHSTRCFQVAYSGGRDSHVLLLLMALLRDRLGLSLAAIHIDHGLNARATEWSMHCLGVCQALAIPLQTVLVNAQPAVGQSPEDAARRARYAAFADSMNPGDCLLTAHHEDDQAETVLLQLLRGSGPEGLSAMPLCTSFAAGLHLRPFLSVTRERIDACARAQDLSWIEDPSNADTAYDRNRLRQEIMPLLRAHWPAMSRTISRSARHCSEAAGLLHAQAERDLSGCLMDQPGVLSLAAVRALSVDRQAWMLRFWIKQRGLPTPASKHLEQIQDHLLAVARDRVPEVCWANVMLRSWRDRLYVGDREILSTRETGEHPVLTWHGERVDLPRGGCLWSEAVLGQGIRQPCFEKGVITVRYRQGGERCRRVAQGPHHPLKSLLQGAGIPPWQRHRLPLIYIDDALVAVAGLWVCADFVAPPGEAGVRVCFGH